MALYAKLTIDKSKGRRWKKVAATVIVRDLPVWDEKLRSIDYYYWHYGAVALSRYDGPKGSAWKAYRASLKKALMPNQMGYGRANQEPICSDGSWRPEVGRWSVVGGGVYATAINTLTLLTLQPGGGQR